MVFGLLNYHRVFIPNFAKKAAAISRTYGAKRRFSWPPEAEKAFSALMMDFKADRKIRDYSGKTATSYLRNVINSDLELKRK